MLQERIELSSNPYHGFVLPLNYRSSSCYLAYQNKPIIFDTTKRWNIKIEVWCHFFWNASICFLNYIVLHISPFIKWCPKWESNPQNSDFESDTYANSVIGANKTGYFFVALPDELISPSDEMLDSNQLPTAFIAFVFAVSILNLVLPPGIEPGSLVLQTSAMTTSAKAAYWICKYWDLAHFPTFYQYFLWRPALVRGT